MNEDEIRGDMKSEEIVFKLSKAKMVNHYSSGFQLSNQ